MRDIIYRQDAIDAMSNALIRVFPEHEDIARKAIGALPSAEPEEIALHESCTDCPLYDKDRHSCPRFNKIIPETLREVQSEQRWIPCSEMMPEIEELVLVTDDSGGVKTVDVDRCGQYECSEKRFWYYTQNVIAWMPLPEPYEGRKDDI